MIAADWVGHRMTTGRAGAAVLGPTTSDAARPDGGQVGAGVVV